MKIFLVVLIALVGVNALTEEQEKKIEGHIKYCSEKTGIERDLAGKYRTSVISDDSEINQCFVKCWLERIEFMNADGELQKDVMFRVIGHGKTDEQKADLSKLIEKCTALSGETLCNTAFQVHNCYYNNVVAV